MASESFAYDHPEYSVTHTFNMRAAANAGGANTSIGKFPVFAASRLKSIHAIIVTAGTNDVAGYNVLNGTTSVGSITCGTATAGSIITKVEIPAATAGTCTDFFDIQLHATSSTMATELMLTYEVLAGATITK